VRLPPKQQSTDSFGFLHRFKSSPASSLCFNVFPIQRWMHSQPRLPSDRNDKPQASQTPEARDCHHETRPVDCTAGGDDSARGFAFALVSAALE